MKTQAIGAARGAPDQEGETGRIGVSTLSRIVHFAVLLAALGIGIVLVAQSGYGNSYYAAAVRSMLESWHNFFFVSYDPGGFITVDKPPLAIWLQTLSAAIFGYRGWALLLPSLLAQVASVELLYRLVRRAAGEWGGLIAALLLALSPINALLSATNETDPVLIFLMLAAAWALFRSIEERSVRFLLLSALFVGLGFNTKMLQAYLILPALFAAYFFAARYPWKQRIAHLAGAALVVGIISFAWITIVDLVPASDRPYVGSTTDNSELSLAIGYNGTQRLFGQTSGFMLGASGSERGGASFGAAMRGASSQGEFQGGPGGQPSQGGFGGAPGGTDGRSGGPGGGGIGGGGNTAFGGQAGIFRLWGNALGGQIGWFVALALGGLAAIALRERPRLPLSRRLTAGVFWGMWFVTAGAVFSIAQFMHPYYTATLMPAIAALCGIGIVQLFEYVSARRAQRWLLPAALLAAAFGQWAVISNYSSYTYLAIAVALIVALCTALIVRELVRAHANIAMIKGALAGAIVALCIAPAMWTGYTMLHVSSVSETIPTAGPDTQSGMNGGPGAFGGAGRGGEMPSGMMRGNRGGEGGSIRRDQGGEMQGGPGGMNGGLFGSSTVDTKLLAYLEAHQGNAAYLVATESSHAADGLIIQSGKPVMAWGGFSGADPAITLAEFKQYVADGTVRYVYISEGGGMGGVSDTSTTSISSWASSSCTAVSEFSGLYDCSSAVE